MSQRYTKAADTLPTLMTLSIYRDGVFHTRLTGSMADGRRRVIGLSNGHPEHRWECVDE